MAVSGDGATDLRRGGGAESCPLSDLLLNLRAAPAASAAAVGVLVGVTGLVLTAGLALAAYGTLAGRWL